MKKAAFVKAVSKSFFAAVKILGWTFLSTAMLLPRTLGMGQERDAQVQPQIDFQSQAQPGLSQNQNASPNPSAGEDQSQAPPAPIKLVLPAGTKIALGLVRPLSFKNTKPGSSVYLQTTFPVAIGNQMVIPPGAYVQGVIDSITGRDKYRQLITFTMLYANVILSNGYAVRIAGPVAVDPTISQLAPPSFPPGAPPIPVMAAAGGPAPPPLPPLPSTGPSRGAIVGIAVGGIAGPVILGLLIAHNHDVIMQIGSPVEITLPAPLELDQDRINEAVHDYAVKAAVAPPNIVKPPKKMKTCWTAGTPGTPDTVIPGTPDTVIPGTPDITIPGDPPTTIPGFPPQIIPGTPPTVIPGTPGTPATSYPCPD